MRVVAWALDLLIALFISLPLAPFAAERIVIPTLFVAIYVYRRIFGRSPGEQIVGIDATSLGRQVVRALVGLVAILYIGLTVGAGAMISTLTNEKISSWRVDVLPVESSVRDVTLDPSIRHQFPAVSFVMPKRINGQPLEVSNCCLFYGGTPSEDSISPGVLVFVSQTLHPYDYCKGVTIAAAGRLAGCADTPVEFQSSVLNTTRASRWKIWSPVSAVRTNFALIAKNIYLEELEPGQPLEHFTRGNAEVFRFRGSRRLVKKKETVDAVVDRFLIADGERFVGVDVIWKKVARDPMVADLIARTLEMRPGSAGVISSELAAAETGDAVPHLMNAFRLDHARGDVVAKLNNALSAQGTQRERNYFELVKAPPAAAPH